MYRTDRHKNPTAFTTDLAQQAGLTKGTDYDEGEIFMAAGHEYHTAKLLGDPIAITIRLLDRVGYYTRQSTPRWTYIAIPQFVWLSLSADEKKKVIGFHYMHEGGTAMKDLFA